MFRNSREGSTKSTGSAPKLSTGRPPTPPGTLSIARQATTMAPRNANKPTTPRPNSNTIASAFSKQPVKKSAMTKTPVRANGNILNFFKKVDNPLKDDDSLFVAQRTGAVSQLPPRKSSPEIEDDDLYGASDGLINERYNEAEGSIKKRKLSDNSKIEDSEENSTTPSIPTEPCTPPPAESPMTTEKVDPVIKAPRRSGPFLDDSDSDEDFMGGLKTGHHIQAQTRREEIQTEDSLKNGVAELDIKKESFISNTAAKSSTETVLPLGGSVFKPKKRVPVARAQAKWEALQPRSTRTMSLSEDEGQKNFKGI